MSATFWTFLLLLLPLVGCQSEECNDVNDVKCKVGTLEESHKDQEHTMSWGNTNSPPTQIKVRDRTYILSDEVMAKFRLVMEHLFNVSRNRDFFDVLASPNPLAVFRLPAQKPASNLSKPLENPRNSAEEREFLRETASSQSEHEETRSPWADYARYWREYYNNRGYQQPAQSYYQPYDYRYYQQQPSYQPYQSPRYAPQYGYNYNYHSPYGPQQTYQSAYSPNYYQSYPGLGLQSGLNVGLGNGVGFGIQSGIGFTGKK